MTKEIIAEARVLAPTILNVLEQTDVITGEQKSAVLLVSGIVIDVISALEDLIEGGAEMTEEAKKAIVEAAAAARFAAKFKEDL